MEYSADPVDERDHQDGFLDASVPEAAMLHLVRLPMAVYPLGIGALDASAAAHRDEVVDGSLLEVRPDVGVEKSVGRARVGQGQVA